MPYADVVAVPCSAGVLLVDGTTVAVIHVYNGIVGSGKCRDLHPGNQLAGGRRITIPLIVQLG